MVFLAKREILKYSNITVYIGVVLWKTLWVAD